MFLTTSVDIGRYAVVHVFGAVNADEILAFFFFFFYLLKALLAAFKPSTVETILKKTNTKNVERVGGNERGFFLLKSRKKRTHFFAPSCSLRKVQGRIESKEKKSRDATEI